MGVMLDTIGKLIARYLQHEAIGFEPFTPSDPERLRTIIQPGDVLLVEGNNRISGVIKYLTQSTWSHAALFVGPIDGAYEPNGEQHVMIEANIGEGVVTAPLSKYYAYHTRVCRPVGLSYEDRETVCRYAINRVGFGYDTKNIVDLMRFLIPTADPAEVAAADDRHGLRRPDPDHLFGTDRAGLRGGALSDPAEGARPGGQPQGPRRAGSSHIRNSSLYMPRDFDISPYFSVVKPTIEEGFRLHRPALGRQAESRSRR